MAQARETRPPPRRPGTHKFLRALLSGAGWRGGLGTGSRDSAGTDAAAELVLASTFTKCRRGRAASSFRWRFLSALRPDWRLPERARVDELFNDPRTKLPRLIGASSSSPGAIFSWRWIAALKLYEKLPWKPLAPPRTCAKRKQWMLEHMERTEGLAAIYPAMMNSIFALMALGHGPDDPLTCARDQRIFALRNRRRRHNSLAAVRFAGVGHLPSPWSRWKKRACRRIILRW